jgi:RNA polymerase sigma-70 factor (ECF subfamily)
VAISMLRRRLVEKKSFSQSSGENKTFNSPVDELDSKNMQDTLRICLARLPEHLRNVLTLRDLAEMSYTQIGGILGISAGTARVYRCKAIRLLALWMCKD